MKYFEFLSFLVLSETTTAHDLNKQYDLALEQHVCVPSQEFIWGGTDVSSKDNAIKAAECFDECKAEVKSYIENYTCEDDFSRTDNRGENCSAYMVNPVLCGMFDTVGPMCEAVYPDDDCDGRFQADQMCCACKPAEPPSDFCCHYEDLGS